MSDEDRAIIQAYEAVRQGFSPDRVVLDPELNSQFIKSCHDAGLNDNAAAINLRLFNLRKKGRLTNPLRAKTTSFEDEDYRFAAEIAVRIIQRRSGESLDAILCDPALCRQLDELANGIVPGFTPLQYRWAALNLRKSKQLTPEILGRVIQSEQVLSFRVDGLSISEIPDSQGLYIFYDAPKTLYVGEASNLKLRLKKHLGHSDNPGLARWLWEHGAGGVLLEVHVLPEATPKSHRKALETELIRSRIPIFNVQRS